MRSNARVRFPENVKNVSEYTKPSFVSQGKRTATPRTNRVIPRTAIRHEMQIMERILETLHLLDAQFFFLVDLNEARITPSHDLHISRRNIPSCHPIDFVDAIVDLMNDVADFIHLNAHTQGLLSAKTTSNKDHMHMTKTTRYMTGRGTNVQDPLETLMIIRDFAHASRLFQIHHRYSIQEPFTEIRVINPFQKATTSKRGRFTIKVDDITQNEGQNSVIDFIQRFYDVLQDVPLNPFSGLRIQFDHM